jgi:hypothetical protein
MVSSFGWTLITTTISPRKTCQKTTKSLLRFMLYGLLDNKPSQNPCIAAAPFCTDSSSARHLENRAKIVLKWLPQFLCLEQLYDLLNSYCTRLSFNVEDVLGCVPPASFEFVPIPLCCYSFLLLKLSWSFSEYE